jgi:hypothetical protein
LAINKSIFKMLLEKRKVTPQRVYQLIDDKKKQYNYAITIDTAAYLVAAENGIDISRYLEEKELEKVREAGGSVQSAVILAIPKKSTERQRETGDLGVKISADIRIIDPYLPKAMLEEAKRMTTVYPVVYVFENSVRSLILNIMKAKYGDEWFEKKVSGKVQRRVKERIDNEDRNRWHGKRRSNPVFYTDIEDLESIIDSNWNDFRQFFPDQVWVKAKIEEIEMSRNTIAHNNPLEDRDITRLKINLEDWVRQISRWAEKQRGSGKNV